MTLTPKQQHARWRQKADRLNRLQAKIHHDQLTAERLARELVEEQKLLPPETVGGWTNPAPVETGEE